MKWGTNLDLNKNELQNFKLQNLATPPANPTLGQPYFNTTDRVAYMWNGTQWRNLFSMSIEEIVNLINESSLKIDDDNLSSNVNDAISKRHSHSNAVILNAITQTLIDKWNAAESNAKQYADSIKPTKTSQLTNDSDFATNASVDEKIDNYKVKPATATTLGGIKVGANLSVNEDGTLSANDNPASFIIKQEAFTVQPGQTIFNLTKGSYKPNTKSLFWFMYGDKQSNDALEELSSTSFSIKGGLELGTEILVEYIELINAHPFPYHANEHLTDGADPIPKVTSSSDGLMSKEDKSKLDGVESGANKYVHPSSHAASMITQDSSHRFVSDSEKSTWNGKASTAIVTTSANGLMSASDKNKLDGISSGAQPNQNTFANVKVGTTTVSADNPTDTIELVAGTNIVITPDATNDKVTINNTYTHPSNHSATMITEDSTHRFVTDAEKVTWNAKETTSGAQAKANTAESNAKAYTDTKVAALVDSSPATLDTLNELANALGDDPNFATTIMNKIGEKETPAGAQAKATTAENNAKAYTNSHAGDTTKHITTAERSSWNSRTRKYTANIGNGTATEYNLAHNLNTKDLTVGIEEVATGEMIFTDILKVDVNNIKVLFSQPPSTNQYRITVIG